MAASVPSAISTTLTDVTKADVPGKKAGTTAVRLGKPAADAELVSVLLRIPTRVLTRVWN